MTTTTVSNLLHDEWTVEALEALLAATPRVALLPPLDAPEWRRVAADPKVQLLVKPLRARTEQEAAEPLPELPDDLYADFHRTGVRLRFERVYFERRRRLARAAVALLLCAVDDPWRARLEASVLAKLTAIFAEASWALPAHTSNVSGKEPERIDLFCAETANLMAEMLDLFGAILSAELQGRISDRLRHGIFENYRDRFEQHNWTSITNNWNAVCHQGVLGAALSQLDDPHLLAEMLLLARRSLPLFLAGYTEDGGTSEGPGYWDYGFGWFTVLNEQLETRTAGRLSLFAGNAKVREIARFGPRTTLRGEKLVNFSDGAAEGLLRPSILAYLGERLHEPLCRDMAQVNYRGLLESGLKLDAERGDLFYFVRVLLRCPEKTPADVTGKGEDCFLPHLAVVIAHGRDRRGHHWDFAAKAGHNHEHHNHNDCGSYLLNIDGERLVAEIGAPEYVKAFFGPQRYEFLAARTLGHSLPIINGSEQAEEEPRYASEALECQMGDAQVRFSLEAAKCYRKEAFCERFMRTFLYEKTEGRVTVTDAFELTEARSLETAVIAIHPVLLLPEMAVIQVSKLRLAVRPDAETLLAGVERHPYQDHDGEAALVHRIVLRAKVLSKSVQLGYTLELLEN